jgi:hypothetical protein
VTSGKACVLQSRLLRIAATRQFCKLITLYSVVTYSLSQIGTDRLSHHSAVAQRVERKLAQQLQSIVSLPLPFLDWDIWTFSCVCEIFWTFHFGNFCEARSTACVGLFLYLPFSPPLPVNVKRFRHVLCTLICMMIVAKLPGACTCSTCL